MRKKTSVSTWNSYFMGHTNMEQSLTSILLTTQTLISHFVHVYYIIKIFYIFHSVSCVLYEILDTRKIDLSLWD